MEGKTTLIYIVGHISAAQMIIAQTVENLAGLHQAAERLAVRLAEHVIAQLEREVHVCPDIPPMAYHGCGGFEAELFWPEERKRELELALLPREFPKLAEMEPRQHHEPPVFRGYMNGRDTRRKRW